MYIYVIIIILHCNAVCKEKQHEIFEIAVKIVLVSYNYGYT